MTFDSLTFLVFLLIVMVLHHLPLGWTLRKGNLLLASYLFYAAWNPPFVLLLALSTLADWYLARGIARSQGPARRRALLVASLVVNLGLLGFFKYGEFLLENFVALLGLFGIAFHPAAPDIVLPVGISFYTFQTLSYTIDVYRGRNRPWHSFLDYALFVSFFPQLVAGPIVRSGYFLPQCIEPKSANARQLGWGFSLLAIGLLQKVVLADALMAPIVEAVYDGAQVSGFVAAWIGTLAFSGQVFFDFSGYSTCAIGVAMCLGFALPDNFRFPYGAQGFADLWRRWHITLATWMRDYVYTPLGGNRVGELRSYLNSFLTMLVVGIWHGASWMMALWGGIHGVYLVLERIARARGLDTHLARLPAAGFLLALFTFFWWNVAVPFFRSPTLGRAWELVTGMLFATPGELELGGEEITRVLVVVGLLFVAHYRMRDSSLEELVEGIPWWGRALALAAIVVALIVTPGGDRAFIYFQF